MLENYRKKRKFGKSKTVTPEPKPGKIKKRNQNLIFVLQKHQAKNLHYDFRLEMGGVLKSWALPKGMPKKVNMKNLAIQTEDHPLEYAEFEGEIPKNHYGAGSVKIINQGNYQLIKGSVEKGYLQFYLRGDKLKGIYDLIKFKPKKSLKSKQEKKDLWLIFKSK